MRAKLTFKECQFTHDWDLWHLINIELFLLDKSRANTGTKLCFYSVSGLIKMEKYLTTEIFRITKSFSHLILLNIIFSQELQLSWHTIGSHPALNYYAWETWVGHFMLSSNRQRQILLQRQREIEWYQSADCKTRNTIISERHTVHLLVSMTHEEFEADCMCADKCK